MRSPRLALERRSEAAAARWSWPSWLNEALATAATFRDLDLVSQVHTYLIPHLSELGATGTAHQAIAMIGRITNEPMRVATLVHLAQNAAFEMQDAVVRASFEALSNIRFDTSSTHPLEKIIDLLPDDLVRPALALAIDLQFSLSKNTLIYRLADRLPNLERETILYQHLADIDLTETYPTAWLRKLSPHLPDCLWSRYVNEINALTTLDRKSAAFGAISAVVPLSYMPQMIHIAASIGFANTQIKDIFDRVSEASFNAIIRASKSYTLYQRAVVLGHLAHRLPKSTLNTELAAILAAIVADGSESPVLCLRVIAAHLPKKLASQAKLYIETLEEEQRDLCLVYIQHLLPLKDRKKAFLGALKSAISSYDEMFNVLLYDLISYFRSEYTASSLALIESIQSAPLRHRCTALLLRKLPDHIPQSTADRLFKLLDDLFNEEELIEDLIEIGTRLNGPNRNRTLADAIDIASGMRDPIGFSTVFGVISPHLPEHLVGFSFAAIRSMGNEWARADAFRELCSAAVLKPNNQRLYDGNVSSLPRSNRDGSFPFIHNQSPEPDYFFDINIPIGASSEVEEDQQSPAVYLRKSRSIDSETLAPAKVGRAEGSLSVIDAAREIIARASPAERLLISNMLSSGHGGISAQPPVDGLGAEDLKAFLTFAAQNAWKVSSGKPPSEFIATVYEPFLVKGLSLSNVRAAQRNLASAYSTEVSRNPSKRIPSLAVKPHALPPDAPLRPRSTKRVAQLSAEELEDRRRRDRYRKASSRSLKPT